MRKINLGCGTNSLEGWENHDSDLDIRKPLPYADKSIDFIFCEHCVEHLTSQEAYLFFKECFRSLKSGGIVRIAVPSLLKIIDEADLDYLNFISRFGFPNTIQGACEAIIFGHGHLSVWTPDLLCSMLRAGGFKRIVLRAVGESSIDTLKGIEGHGKAIGERFNNIESIVSEAEK